MGNEIEKKEYFPSLYKAMDFIAELKRRGISSHYLTDEGATDSRVCVVWNEDKNEED